LSLALKAGDAIFCKLEQVSTGFDVLRRMLKPAYYTAAGAVAD
jgi:hypothetical protein